jgi:hypothetical protein
MLYPYSIYAVSIHEGWTCKILSHYGGLFKRRRKVPLLFVGSDRAETGRRVGLALVFLNDLNKIFSADISCTQGLQMLRMYLTVNNFNSFALCPLYKSDKSSF